ncbi:MAG: TniQ family protein [Chitinimonas sp.]|nr:TniQ family protein [Chitinimonas sp.]
MAVSHLFSLTPICQPSARRESLTSYLVRLARAHFMSPRQLIKTEFVPRLSVQSGPAYAKFCAEQAKTVNGVGKYAKSFGQVAEQLTCRPDLHRLTMLPWKGVIPEVGTGLIAHQIRWCPHCLAEQRVAGEESYFPLVWSLTHYAVCLKHQHILESTCPKCSQAQHVFSHFPDQARCSHCGAFLGHLAPNPTISSPAQRQIVLAGLVEHAVANNESADAWATHDNLCAALRRLAADHANGEKGLLSHKLGLTKTSVSCWTAKGQKPAFPQLLQIAEATQLTLPELLQGKEAVSLVTPEPLIEIQARQVASESEMLANAEMLKVMLADKSALPMIQAARRIGLTKSQMTYRHRELGVALTSKFYATRTLEARQRQAGDVAEVHRVVRMLLMRGQWVTGRRASVYLRREGLSLKRPVLREALKDAIVASVKRTHPFG